MAKMHRIKDKKAQGPILSWVPVPGPDGRIHMEMRWHVGQTHERSRHAHSAA